MSTPEPSIQDFDSASLRTIITGSNETMNSANKSMFFLEMNPFAPISVVLLHMLCKFPSRVCLSKRSPALPPAESCARVVSVADYNSELVSYFWLSASLNE